MNEFPEKTAELTEEQLDEASGGGSGLALCIFEASLPHDAEGDRGNKNSIAYDDGAGGYVSYCGNSGSTFCNWVLCRCWKTSHCKNGMHICDKNGRAFPFHAITS